MKAYAYIRVSTKNQAEEDKYGIPVQVEDIKKYAEKNNIEIIDTFIDDGYSGGTIERPALTELLMEVEKKKVDAVIVAKLDRIARDLMLHLWIEKELKKDNVELISVAEPFQGNNPMNTLYKQIIGAFAEFEKSRITERLKGGRRQKSLIGGYAGGRPALGYKVKVSDRELIIEPSEAEIVKQVFTLRANGLTYDKIAAKLNSAGYKTKENKKFFRMQVKRIIDRENLYKGNYSYNGITATGKQEAILY